MILAPLVSTAKIDPMSIHLHSPHPLYDSDGDGCCDAGGNEGECDSVMVVHVTGTTNANKKHSGVVNETLYGCNHSTSSL